MEQQNPNNTPDGLGGDVPLKRKRGRPRKYPRPDAEESSYIALNQSKMQNPVRTEHVPVPIRFNAVNGNQQLQRAQENISNNATVGQAVSGVIEAIFEAGYLLSVRIAGSDTTLRGLVFKPECYVPVSPENDVAPGVPMIQRNEVPFPSRTTQFQTPPPPPKANNVSGCKVETLAMNGLPTVPQVPMRTVNLVASSGNNFPSVVGQTTDQLARGTVIPSVLQPSNFSNGMSQVTPVSIGSGVIAGKEVAVYGNQEATSNAQTSQNMMPSRLQTEGVSHYQSSDALNGNETKSLTAPNVHFEQLVTEVVRRIETPADAMDTETGNNKRGVKDPSPVQEGKINDMDQSVLTKPLQTVQSPSDAVDTETGNSKPGDNILVKDPNPGLEDKVNDMDPSVLNKPLVLAVQSSSDAMDIETGYSKPANIIPVKDPITDLQEDSTSAPKDPGYTETGKMVELLQVLQNDKTENQATKAAELESENKVDHTSNSGTGL